MNERFEEAWNVAERNCAIIIFGPDPMKINDAVHRRHNCSMNLRQVFSINNATPNRFYSPYFILSMVILLNLSPLHLTGSSNPIG